MSTRITNGKRGVYLQPAEFGVTENGPYTRYTWIGTRGLLRAYTTFVVNAGGLYVYKESPTGEADTLEATFPRNIQGVEAPQNQWELLGTPEMKDVLESNLAVINLLSDDERRAIRDAIQNPDPNYDPTDPNAEILLSDTAVSVYKLMLNGYKSVKIPVPTLRHTMTTSNQYAIPGALFNVGNIITPDSMVGIEGAPLTLNFPLPNGVSNRDGMRIGWLKNFPTIRVAAGLKNQIEQDYEFGLWPTLLYTIV